jgi:hypothetical protein
MLRMRDHWWVSKSAILLLLFADDSLILMRANLTNADALHQALQAYCASSGQLVSEAKSSIFFSPYTSVEMKEAICLRLNILTEAITDTDLGLPTQVGVDRSDCFIHLIERVVERLKGYKEKLLSCGGKEVLLKAVAQAIPAYSMSVFKLPKQVIKGITDAMTRYWWGDDYVHKHMHWFSWWKMCVPKKKGGMCIRNLNCFNLAMLAR